MQTFITSNNTDMWNTWWNTKGYCLDTVSGSYTTGELKPQIYLSFRAHTFVYLGTICLFSWNCIYVSHWRFYDNRPMNTSADVSEFQIVPVHAKCWILLKPVLEGVGGSLHLTVPSMNRINQNEPATFSIMQCWILSYSYFRRIKPIFISIWRDSVNKNHPQ
jgi:hypothetical protein